MPSTPKIAYGFFCELLREERGKKMTAMGIWGSRCVLQGKPPKVLGGLALLVHVHDPDQQPELPVHFTVTLPDEPKPLIDETVTAIGTPGHSGRTINVSLGGVVIQAPGFIRARMEFLYDTPLVGEFELEVRFSEDPSVFA